MNFFEIWYEVIGTALTVAVFFAIGGSPIFLMFWFCEKKGKG